MSELQDVIDEMESLMYNIKEELSAVKTNQSAAARVRKATSALDKQNKRFRQLSVAHHKK